VTVTVRIPPATVRVLAVVSDQAIRVSIPGSTGGSGGGGGAVSSVFGRAGDVTAQSGDYAVAQITGLQDALDAKASEAFVLTAVDPYNVAFTGTGGQANVGDALVWVDGQIAGLYADLSGKAGLFSPTFTGAPSAPTAAGGTNTTQLATTAFVQGAVNAIIAAADAMVFKGVIDCSTNPNYPAADRGWTYKVSVAGKIGGASGVNVEAGDTLLCLTDGTASGDHATVGAQWNVTQTNLDGAVIGPASSVDGYFALFSGTSGKLLTSVSPTAVKAALGIVVADVSGFDAAVAANAAVVANTAKVTNATHTGDVTGSGALTIDKTAITGKAAVTAEAGVDYMLISDTSDSGNLKKALIPSGGGVTVRDEGTDIVVSAGAINFTGAGVTVTDVSGVPTVAIPGGSSGPTPLSSTSTGTQNDWSPGTLGADTIVNWSGASSLLATGISGGSDGYRLTFRNNAVNRIAVFAQSNTGSSSSNRISVGNRDPIIVLPGETTVLIHNGTNWLLAQQPSGGPRDNWNEMRITPGVTGSYGVLGTTAFDNGGTPNTQGIDGTPTTYKGSAPRSTWSTGAGAGTNTGVRTNPTTFHRGSTAGLGGGCGMFVWSFDTLPASAETWFVGFGPGTIAPSNIDASARLEQVGWGRDPADSAQVRLMHNDSAGTSTKVDLGATFPENTTVVFGGLIFMSAQADGFPTVLWRRDDPTVTPSVNDVTTNLITQDLRLQPILWMNNRAAAANYVMSSHQPMRLWCP
jgi:hypothetical protein